MIINKKLAQMMVEKPIKADVSNIENKLYLYGSIGNDWNGVSLDDVKNTVKEMDKSKVTVYINSYGGDATEGVAIRNFLRDTFSHIDVVIDGIAASAATVIASCGDSLTMPVGTTFMIHNPWLYTMGNRKELMRDIKMLESMEKSYQNIYMERFNGTEDELIQLMDDESWLTAEQAEELGFVSKVEEVEGDDADEDKATQDNALVAKLVAKYATQADDITDENDDYETNSKDNEADEDSEKDTDKDKEKPNNLLKNFAKVFSNFE